MTKRDEASMRRYWDERAKENAAWYVDTSLRYDDPDLEQFFATGRAIVEQALADCPTDWVPGGTAVEIGSGLGRIALALADRFDEVIGVDISAEMIERARELVSDERVSFQVGSGSSLQPIADGSANFVLSFTVFQHIPVPEVIEGYIVEAGRVLQPGGLLAFQWNNSPGARRWALRRSVLSLLQRTGVKREQYGRHAPEFLGSTIPLPRISAALERGGLILHKTEGLGTLYGWAWARKPPP